MGALLVYFVVGSIVAVPFLGYQLLRTRRELNQLRAELRQRGLIAPALDVDGSPAAIPTAGRRAVPAADATPAALASAAPGPTPARGERREAARPDAARD